MSVFNETIIQACNTNKDMLCKVLFDICRYEHSQDTLSESLIEGMEKSVIVDYIKPEKGNLSFLDNENRDKDVGYRIVSALIEGGKEQAALKLITHFNLDIFLGYKSLSRDNKLCLLSHAIHHNCQWLLEGLVLCDYFDPYEKNDMMRLRERVNARFESLSTDALNKNSVLSGKYIMARSLATFLLSHCVSDEFNKTYLLTLFKNTFSYDITSLAMFIDKGVLISDISDRLLIKCSEKSFQMLLTINNIEENFIDNWRFRNTDQSVRTGKDRSERRKHNNDYLRRMIVGLRENAKVEKSLYEAVRICGSSDAMVQAWQKGAFEVIKAKSRGFYVGGRTSHILAKFSAILGKPFVPGAKPSPLANMEWFEGNSILPLVTKGIAVDYLVEHIRTQKQLKLICKGYDLSPSTLLIMHGDKLKPLVRDKCVDSMA